MKPNKKAVVNSIIEIENLYNRLLNTNLDRLNDYKQFLLKSIDQMSSIKAELPNLTEIINLEKAMLSNLNYLELPAYDFEVLKDYKRKIRDSLQMLFKSIVEIYPIEIYVNQENKFKKYINKQNKIQIYSINNNLSTVKSVKNNADVICILIYKEGVIPEQLKLKFDLAISDTHMGYSLAKIKLNIDEMDYYTYTRLFLETKLHGGRSNKDVEILLAGSSYTVCGLNESQMPIKARNIAIDAQDLYYTIKSIEKSLTNYKNIKYIILPFAYYLWGNDISLSISNDILRGVKEINYPIFLDAHNYSSNMNDFSNEYLKPEIISPLEMTVIDFDSYMDEKYSKIKYILENKDYYRWPRTESIFLGASASVNESQAKKRANGHNKFLKYKDSIQENINLFKKFVVDMEERGIELLVYVPPVSQLYRKYIKTDLISHHNELMDWFRKQYNFKYIDLFNSEIFTDKDFYDYDHLNDHGARKLEEIIISQLNLQMV